METQLIATWALDAEEQERAKLESRVATTKVVASSGLLVDAAPHLRALFERYAFDSEAAKFEYFPANRNLEGSPGLRLPAQIGSFHDRLTRSEGKYAWITAFLAGEEQRRALVATRHKSEAGVLLAGELDVFRLEFNRKLSAFKPDLRFAGARETKRGFEPTFALRGGSSVLLSELSASQQQAVLFVAAHGHLGLDNAVLLVDEPELHQHPAAHARILDALTRLSSKQQLIVATSSAAILRSATSDSVIQLPAIQ